MTDTQSKRTSPMKGRRSRIMEVFRENEGRIMHFTALTRAGFQDEIDADGEEAAAGRVNTMLASMSREEGTGVFRKGSGEYVFHSHLTDDGPEEQPQYPSLWEHIGFSREGALLLRADDGSLWYAERAGSL